MTIKITIPNEQAPEILEVLQRLLTGSKPATPQQQVRVHAMSEVPTPTRATKAALPPEDADDEPEAPAAPVKETPKNGKKEPGISLEALRAIALPISKKSDKHKVKVKSLLTKYGADNFTSLAPEHFADFLTDLNAL